VTDHDFDTHNLLLTPNKPGTLPVETRRQRGSQARPQRTTPTGTGQAEQPGGQAEMQLPLGQPQQAATDGDQAGGVGEPEVHPDAQDELGGRADELDDQSRPGAVLQKSVQSPTILGVVLRCVSVQENIICTQLITSPKLGTSPLCTNQAEQHHSREDLQASPQSSHGGRRGQGEHYPCDSPQPSRARRIGRAEQKSSSPGYKTFNNAREEYKSQAEHLILKAKTHEAGGHLTQRPKSQP
jgi:hypothetical protein